MTSLPASARTRAAKPRPAAPALRLSWGGARFACFCADYVRQTKGRWAGLPLYPELWQLVLESEMLRTTSDVMFEFTAAELDGLTRDPGLFYERLADRLRKLDEPPGRRIYTEGYVQVSKKNGKSSLASAHGLYFLVADGESGAEVYSAAAAKDQGRIVFGQARQVVLASPRLLDWIKVYRDALAVPATDSVYRVISADAGVQEGLNPSASIIDELHRHKSRDLYDVLTSGDIARDQPFTLAITNPGVDLDTICGIVYQQAKDVLDGKPGARTDLYAFVPELADADLDDRSKWTGRGSPNPASWITLDRLERNHRRFPLFVFRRRHLNKWTAGESAWLPAGAWDSCYAPDLMIDAGDPAWLAIDMGLKHDTAGRILLAPKDGRLVVRALSWGAHVDPEKPPPEAHVIVSADRVPFDLVENDVRDCARAQQLREAAYDPWRFERSAQTLAAEGIPMLEVPQSHARMCPASQTLFDLIVQGVIAHDGDPILAAHVAAAVAKDTGRGWRLVKRETAAQSGVEQERRARRPVDLAIALAIAASRAQTQPGSAGVFFIAA